jgi:hypothetical protein
MEYNEFKNILNKKIFNESKADLIRKFADYPERYIGLFRPTKPKGKIIQNLTQSAEIKFGDAFEIIIEKYFNLFGFKSLKKIYIKQDRKVLNLDQLFEKDDKIIFIEQKIRDDHDSSKKRGQINNFIQKIEILQQNYPKKEIEAIFYFIDDALKKNRNYYQEKIDEIKKDYGIECYLYYGRELFEKYKINVWNEIIRYLKQWKNEIPELPEINFDKDVEKIFEEIKKVEPHKFKKILSNDEIFNQMMLTISPQKKLLKKLLDFFQDEYKKYPKKKIYKTLSDLLSKKI